MSQPQLFSTRTTHLSVSGIFRLTVITHNNNKPHIYNITITHRSVRTAETVDRGRELCFQTYLLETPYTRGRDDCVCGGQINQTQ